MLVRFILFLAMLNSFCDPVEIEGLLIHPGSTDSIAADVTVILKTGGRLLASSTTDNFGHFQLLAQAQPKTRLDFFAVGKDRDTVLIASVAPPVEDISIMTLYYPARITRNAFGKVKCLRCHKADKVYKIRYGDGLPMASKLILANGDTTYSPIVQGHYNAGSCIVTTSTWYCHRDKVKF